MNKKFVVHARVLKAMSDENRLRILDLLLLQAGAVKARKNGKWTYYSLNKEIFSTVSEWIAEYGE